MSLFTPIPGLVGGMLIGLAADTLLLFNGDILGASGIVSTAVLNPGKALSDSSQHWKLVFLASFLTTSAFLYGPQFDLEAASSRPLSMTGYALAGLFVGFGTKMGNGCTSGHGICGLPRLSKRSFTAVMTFMATGIATSVLTSPSSKLAPFLAFLHNNSVAPVKMTDQGIYVGLVGLLAALIAPLFYGKKGTKDDKAKLLPAAVSGFLFSTGLFVSKMVSQSKVHGFLDVSKMTESAWDGTLAMVMGGGVIVSFVGYQFLQEFRVLKKTKTLARPICLSDECKFGVPTNQTIDKQLVFGSACFGIGWGLGGICPGPALFLAGIGAPGVLMAWFPSFFVGSYIAQELKK